MKARAAESLRIPQNLFVSVVLALSISLAVVLVGPGHRLPEVTPRPSARVRRRRGDTRRRPRGDAPLPLPRPHARPTSATADASLYAAPQSPARPFAQAIAWLWRLGPVDDRPGPQSVGIGTAEEAAELAAAAREGHSAGAMILAPGSGAESGELPARRAVSGVAGFAPGAGVYGDYTVFAHGAQVVATRLGLHAVRPNEKILLLGCDPVSDWGRLSALWALQPAQAFLLDRLERPLLQLPPIGCLRFDDLPGTAYQQLAGEAKSDARVTRQIRRLVRSYAASSSVLNIAVAARGLRGSELVATEELWPRGTEALAEGVEQGAMEPVCHGLLHLDRDRSAWEPEPREFAHLDADEAGHRLDLALAWQRRILGEPRTFVAPAWGYSAGTLAAAARRGLPAWRRPTPERLLVNGNPRETLVAAGALGGVHRLEYDSLVRLAAAGLPPTPVFHGDLLDGRIHARVLHDAFAYARLLITRDSHRLARLPGVRWVGAGELVERLAAHGRSEVRGSELALEEGAEEIAVSRSGRRLVRA